jgi:hypothetical protein
MCPPWIEGAHAGAPLQNKFFLTSMNATWYQLLFMKKIAEKQSGKIAASRPGAKLNTKSRNILI